MKSMELITFEDQAHVTSLNTWLTLMLELAEPDIDCLGFHTFILAQPCGIHPFIVNAYRQYRQLKSQQNTHGAVNGTAQATPTDSQDEDEVFGTALNKPAKEKDF